MSRWREGLNLHHRDECPALRHPGGAHLSHRHHGGTVLHCQADGDSVHGRLVNAHRGRVYQYGVGAAANRAVRVNERSAGAAEHIGHKRRVFITSALQHPKL